MAGEMQVLASLNRMLESKERREQTRMANALAMMQFAQQKKMQDYQLGASKIAFLKQANMTLQAQEASQFRSETGLEAFDLSDDDQLKAAKEFAVAKNKYKPKTGINTGGLGLTDLQANQLIGAVFRSQNGDHSAILGVATDLAGIMDKPKSSITDEEEKWFEAFQGMGYFHDKDSAIQRLGSIRKSIDNADAIIEEEFELARGDTVIREEIGGFGMDTLADAAEEMDEVTKIVGTPQEELISTRGHIDELRIELSDKQNSITNLQTELESLKALEIHGKLSDEQREYLKRIPSIKQNIETDIMGLSNQIDQNKKLEHSLVTPSLVSIEEERKRKETEERQSKTWHGGPAWGF